MLSFYVTQTGIQSLCCFWSSWLSIHSFQRSQYYLQSWLLCLLLYIYLTWSQQVLMSLKLASGVKLAFHFFMHWSLYYLQSWPLCLLLYICLAFSMVSFYVTEIGGWSPAFSHVSISFLYAVVYITYSLDHHVYYCIFVCPFSHESLCHSDWLPNFCCFRSRHLQFLFPELTILIPLC